MRRHRDPISDVVVAGGLIAVVYATPARLRPALGLATAVALSRVHGAGVARVRDELVRLFDERRSAHGRIDQLETDLGDVKDIVTGWRDRTADLERRMPIDP